MFRKIYKVFTFALICLLASSALFALESKDIEMTIPLALKNGEFVLYFQPLCRFDKSKICGAEALSRWQKEGQVISPGKFIPLFEESGFIKEFDVYVFEKVLKHLSAWQAKGLKINFITLNISALDLDDLTILDKFKQLLAEYKISPELIEIEITETVKIADNEKARAFISGLKALGLRVALDDFGDGYATWDNLKTFSYDSVKLSKKLLKNFEDKTARKNLKATIKALKKYPVLLVAEGIENKKEAAFLKKQGINLAQGYFYYKPMPAEEFEKLLSTKTAKYCNF